MSTCFGHHYAPHQENKTVYYRIWCSALVLLAVVVWSWVVSCVQSVKVAVRRPTVTCNCPPPQSLIHSRCHPSPSLVTKCNAISRTWGCCEFGNEHPGFVKSCEVLDRLSVVSLSRTTPLLLLRISLAGRGNLDALYLIVEPCCS